MRNLCMALVMAGSVAACKFYDPQRVEEDFGNSVRQMIKEQTHSPAYVPASLGPDRLDGPTAVGTVESYVASGNKNRVTDNNTVGKPQ